MTESDIVSEAQPPADQPQYRWYHKVRAVIFLIFCFELGVFLLVFPWLREWDTNWFATYSPALHTLWLNDFFRGALSGVGLINIYISLLEVVRLRRFASPVKAAS